MTNNIRTIIAATLSMIILILWQNYLPQYNKKVVSNSNNQPYDSKLKFRNDSPYIKNKDKNLSHATQIQFRNNFISGSINLVGAKIDNLILLKYKQTALPDSKNITLLSPVGNKDVYYAEFGWLTNNKNIELPNNKSVWRSDKKVLNPNEKVTLFWKNNSGIKFFIQISIDENYMFTIEKKVVGLEPSDIKSYAAMSRNINNDIKSQMLIHEGCIGVFNNKLEEIKFDDLNNKKINFSDSNNGWLGFSDKYWLTAIIPDKSGFCGKFSGYKTIFGNRYQTDLIIDNDEDLSNNHNKIYFFAGAKKLKVLDHYEKKYNIKLFDRAVDFGILYFITKPIFITLNFFHSLVKNFGVAIILLTAFIKLLLFPLAYKGFKGMNKLKNLQPEVLKLKQLCANDNVKLQKAVIELYQREKINPVSGCLPIFLQLPIFFALYKVLYVTLEMRHAKFFLWITDLSANDPTNIFTFFGLIPWHHPSFLHIGILPSIMSLTLYCQQMLNPHPTDPTQAKVIKFLPIIFLFMFSSFPSGLVLYWSCSNILSIIQQVLIKKLTQ